MTMENFKESCLNHVNGEKNDKNTILVNANLFNVEMLYMYEFK